MNIITRTKNDYEGNFLSEAIYETIGQSISQDGLAQFLFPDDTSLIFRIGDNEELDITPITDENVGECTPKFQEWYKKQMAAAEEKLEGSNKVQG